MKLTVFCPVHSYYVSNCYFCNPDCIAYYINNVRVHYTTFTVIDYINMIVLFVDLCIEC